jgi:two-component sensor histidine kinase
MPILVEHRGVGLAEADHRIANNLASLSGVIRLQRNSISRSGRTFTTEQVCMLLDDIDARIEVTAKLHKFLARAVDGNGVDLGNFLQEIAEMIGILGPQGKMDLTVDHSGGDYIEPRHALHAGLITAELLMNASKYAHPTGLPVKVKVHCKTKDDGSFFVEVTDDGVGFPENFDPSTDGGLGFQLMRTLANGLNAELQFEHDSLGVCARLVKRANGASILPFIRKAGIVFDDRVTKVIGEAFDNACRELPTEQSMIVHEVIAKRIIDAAENGERDLVRLRSAGLTALRFDDDDKEAS